MQRKEVPNMRRVTQQICPWHPREAPASYTPCKLLQSRSARFVPAAAHDVDVPIAAGPLAAALEDEAIQNPLLGYLLRGVQLQIEDYYMVARRQTYDYDQVRRMFMHHMNGPQQSQSFVLADRAWHRLGMTPSQTAIDVTHHA